jgi:hypothetical protein
MSRRLRSLLVTLVALVGVAATAAWQAYFPPAPSARELLPSMSQLRPRWWKGNLHTHSLWSDGDDFPEMVADWYKHHGYDFLALSEHNVLAEGDHWVDANPLGQNGQALAAYLARFGEQWVERRTRQDRSEVRLKPLAEFRSVLEEPGRFLLIPAEEITHRFAKRPVHINAINLHQMIAPADGDSVSETIRVNLRSVALQRARLRRPMLGSVNHPNFGWGVRAEDLAALEELAFFEIYNGHPGVGNYGDRRHPGVEEVWDIVLALRLGKLGLPVVYGLATDDAHNYHIFGRGNSNPGRGWVVVRWPFLSAEGMVRGLEAGDFYASTGVTLKDVRRQGADLALSIQGAPEVSYRTQFIATLRDAQLIAKSRQIVSEPRHGTNPMELEPSRDYGPEVGKMVAEVVGLEPRYRFTGKELYVRAKVISSRVKPNPFKQGDYEVAWTQPFVP